MQAVTRERYIGSAELGARWDVEAQLGGSHVVKRNPALADWLVYKYQRLQAERRAECDAKRAKREARWASIAAGDRQPVSILHLAGLYDEAGNEKAA